MLALTTGGHASRHSFTLAEYLGHALEGPGLTVRNACKTGRGKVPPSPFRRVLRALVKPLFGGADLLQGIYSRFLPS